MTAGVPYARLAVADVGRWESAAAAWRALAAVGGVRSRELAAETTGLRPAWSGSAADAAAGRLRTAGHLVDAARVAWWEADQAVSVFAAELGRARRLLDAALAAAARAGLTVGPTGEVSARTLAIPGLSGIAPSRSHAPPSAGGSSGPGSSGSAGSGTAGGSGTGGGSSIGAGSGSGGGTGGAAAGTSGSGGSGGSAPDAAVAAVVAAIEAALAVAARADADATIRLTALADTLVRGAPGTYLTPPCNATPAEVRAWWAGLTPVEQRWLIATQPGTVGALDGVPAAARDQANRLLLDRYRAAAPAGSARREALDALADRLAGDAPRAYLLGVDPAGDGRAVVAVGDPDRADHVLTHVPGMTADLAGLGPELGRAERVAVRAGELAPGARTAAVLWLGYDAPDFVFEASSARQAEAGAEGLRRFQDGLRATHEGPPAHHTLLGHSYGSLVVGTAAARPGLAADDVVLVGSPGVGVQRAGELHGQVWATSSRGDAIQYAAPAPRSLPADLLVAANVPVVGQMLAFGRPEEDLWHGRNPAGEEFGARRFASQASAGHVGYWATDGPALDNLARITVGDAAGVTRP